MKLALLLSGGKDSLYAAYLAKRYCHELSCAISIVSENKSSYMFHTPNISKTKKQAEAMNLQIIFQKSAGKKEIELHDLKKAIKTARKKYKIEGIITGAIQSVYQASRIQKICNELNLECFNPLWQTEEIPYLRKLIKNKFDIVITGVFAYPFNQKWLGRKIDNGFIEDISLLNKMYQVHPAGEGGEFETFVLDCPLFKKPLKIKSYNDIKEGENSWRREIDTE